MGHYTVDELTIGKLDYGVGAPACEYDGKTRYVRITDIDSEGTLGNDYVSPEYYEDKHLLHEGDILFARTGATVGKTYLYSEKDGRCVYAGFLIRAIPNRRMILPAYMYYFTKSPSYLSFVDSSMKVVAQPNINAKQYGSLQINVPDFPIQEKVVAILDTITNLISLRKQQLQKLDDLVKSRFVEITNSAELSEETTVEAITKRVKVGFVGTCEKYYVDDTGVPMLRTGNITDHGIDLRDLKYVSSAFNEKNIKSQIHEGDILIARHGSNGQANVYMGPDAQCLNAVMIVPNQSVARSVFLEALINSADVKEQIEKTLVGSTQRVVNTKTIANLVVRIPSIGVQKEYESFTIETNKTKLSIQQSLDKFELLKQSLMQKYFG